MQMPYIDIILLCYGKFSTMTRPCLESIISDCINPSFRLTVIENGSTDNSAQELREFLKSYPFVRAHYLQDNIGYAGGMNLGASFASAPWLFLVSNDTIFTPNALSTIHKALLEQPSDVGLLGPVTNAAGNEQEYKLRGSASQILNNAKFIEEFPSHIYTQSYRLDFYCVAIRKSLFEQLKGFDPVYGKGYYEDTDFSMRAKKAGYRLMVCEDAFVYHAGSGTFSSDPNTRKLIRRNKKIFLKRHPDAILYHHRQCNLHSLEEFLRHKNSGFWNVGLTIRTKLRIEALKSNLPRSFFKKWLWRLKIRHILKAFDHTTSLHDPTNNN